MGGKRYELDIDDYIVGAIILYTDIITIFIYLLQILGGGGSNE
jgi:FtsH-binding integral membrane protein